ncbi:MAG TPA: hypothetical protein VH134_11515, partial [Candidatus Dormibacteraeota bacterium]|nr:hypothetical protein [Candidatus Dormibacteraeota bacterium]
MSAATQRPLDRLPRIAEALMAQATAGTGAPGPGSLRVVRLRHKPGRGLTAVLRPRVGPEVRLRLDETGASIETGTADAGLPGLAAASAPAPGSELWNALETVARRRLADPGARLARAGAAVVRHKPGARCVLRYDLTVTPGRGGAPVAVGVFGKLFADPARAVEADALLRSLHDEQLAGGRVVVPPPLGVVESLGLA